jgi:signal transduction histidine kinase/CheY-like chemotaxis protein
MPSETYSRIKRRFNLSVGIVLGLLSILSCVHTLHEYRLVVDSAEKRSASYASALKEHGERAFSEADNCIKNLIDDINEQGGMPFTQSERFYRLLSAAAKSGPQFSSVYVVDRSGIIIAHSQEFRMKPVDVADRDYFLHHRDTSASGLFISKPFTSRVSGTSRFNLTRPIKARDGTFLGLVAVTFETSYFERFYKSIELGRNDRVLLATTSGGLLVNEPRYDKPFASDFTSSRLFREYLPAAPRGTHTVNSPITNTLRIMSYNAMGSFPIVAIVSFDRDDVVAPWRSATILQGSIVLFLMGAVLMLAVSSLRHFRKLDQTNSLLEAQQQELLVAIDKLKSSEQREHTRSEILERIARGEELTTLLSFIALIVEQERPGALCSILLASPDNKRLLNGAAPSLPDSYRIATHRTKIGEGIGSCGTAAFRKERVVVEDIASHPFWKGFTPATEAGLRSCWSEPILSSGGKLLGTFAIYHREPAVPGVDEIRLIEQASAFAGIAIERSRNEEERNQLEEQLHQSQKMEAIGHLAGGMAHDFNNLLTPIIVYADLLKRAIPQEDEKALSKLDGIINASYKARDLTRQLLSFGRKQTLNTSAVDLNEIVSSFHSMIRRTLRENIDITLRLSPQVQSIKVDRSKIEQVILNLAINAQDAIEGNGTITVETGQVLVDDEYARQHPGVETGRYVLLKFSDTGCGMSDATLKRIYEPFFTTKQVGHGTGLGLANVYGVIKQHGGHIEVKSDLGNGTVFKLYIPECEELPAAPGQKEPVADEQHTGIGTVLLVEDNDMVREMAYDLLTGMGYTVYAAAHPLQALEQARELSGRINLVLTDVVMPGMNGLELFEALRSEHPDIGGVLYMSGYTNNITTSAMEAKDNFLQKPFTVDSFMTKIRMLLNHTT